ncbi:MAG: alpha/beta fold hydrolase [Spirochaeta sp.]
MYKACSHSNITPTRLLTVAAAMLLFFSCAGSPEKSSINLELEADFSHGEFIPLLSDALPYPVPTAEMHRSLFERYRDFYRIEPGVRTHYAGWVKTQGYRIFIQGLLLPQDKTRAEAGTAADAASLTNTAASADPALGTDTAGTVVLLHGYQEHAGTMSPLIKHFADSNLDIVMVDLPGHGISSGRRVWIEDFTVYGNILRDVLSALDLPEEEKLILVGHSTGGSTILEFLYQQEDILINDPEPDLVVLLAPLVRSNLWNLSRIGITLSGPLPIERISGSPEAGTANPFFLALAAADPLRVNYADLDWVRAVIDWDRRNQSYGQLESPALIVQGTSDVVLNWRYNLIYLGNRLKNYRIRLIEGAEHNLHHEQGENLQLLLDSIDAAIADIPAATDAAASTD